MSRGVIVTVLVIIFSAVIIAVSAQDKPAVYKLSVEASQEYVKIENEKAAISKAYEAANERQRLLLLGAQIPMGLTPKVEGQIITFTQPQKEPK